MDRLYGIIELTDRRGDSSWPGDPVADEFRTDHLLLGQQRTLCNASQSPKIVESAGNVFAMVGEITNLSDLSTRDVAAETDLELIASLYSRGGLAALGALEGLFTMAIFDRSADALFLLQDRFSSPFTLYWTEKGGRLFFATSLKKILVLSGITRELDRQALADFMVNGLVPSSRTLIRELHKLTPGDHLEARRDGRGGVQLGRRSQKALATFDIATELAGLAETYRSVVTRSLRRLLSPLKSRDLHLILTSGFDSNLCLHLARDEHDGPISTYCVGTTDPGEFAGETERARSIAAEYRGVEFFEHVLSESAVLDLPDIVWRIEGAVCERGLFLRNRLARMLSARSNHVVGGDLANQVLNPNFLHVAPGLSLPYLRKLLRHVRHGRRHRARFWNRVWGRRPFGWLHHPQELGLYMNIKQNGSLMSSYSVQLKYPYLDLEFVGLICSIMRQHRVAALELHRSVIEATVSPRVREVLSRPKKGPILEAFCYQDESFRKRVAEEVRRSGFLASIVDKELLDRLLGRFVASNVDALASVVNRLLFLDLWYRMFLSGDFDAQFMNPGLDSPPDFLVS